MTTEDFVNVVCVVSLVAPVIIVLAIRRAIFAILLGGLTHWILTYVCGCLMTELFSEGVLATVLWLMAGWLLSLMGAAILHGLKRGVICLCQSLQTSPGLDNDA